MQIAAAIKKWDWNLLGALLISLLIAAYVEKRIFFDPYAINNDVRNQAYWIFRIFDPSLFAKDYAAQYFSQPSLISPFLYVFYMVLGQWIEPLRLSQFLPIFLVVLATFFLFHVSANYLNKRYAFWTSVVFNFYVWAVPNMAGGLARAFFFPLLFCFLWLNSTRRWLWLVPLLWLQALIYPPVLFLSVGMLCWQIGSQRKEILINRKIKAALAFAIIGSLLILAQRYIGEVHTHQFGGLIGAQKAATMPEFYKGGRVEVFLFHPPSLPESPFVKGMLELLIRLPSVMQVLPLIILILVACGYNRFLKKIFPKPPLPPYIWPMVSVSLLIYCIAALALFIFYLPNRYIQYTLPFGVVVLIGWAVYELERLLWQCQTAILARLGISVVLIMLGFLWTSPSWKPDLIKVYSSQRKLYQYLSWVPKNSQIGASFTIASNIPVFSKRSVFVSREAVIPFHTEYYKEMKSRLADWITVYYSTDPQPISELMTKHKLDYLVIDLRDFEAEKTRQLDDLYFHAFPPDFIQRIQEKAKRKGYILSHIPSSCYSFQSGPYIVLSVRALRTKKSSLQCF